MRKTPWLALLILFLASPPVLSAQNFAIGGRAGTLGLGAEAALGLSDMIAIRGGWAVHPWEISGTFDDESYQMEFPSSMWTAGLDLYLGGSGIRLMGGIMGKSENFVIESVLSGSTEIGGTTYTETGTLTGEIEQADISPFVGIGFGKHTSGGFGFFLDLGVAFMGEPDVVMAVSGDIASIPGIQQDIQDEADKVEEDFGSYIQYYPIVSLGFKFPLGNN
jgi:hypothetical protein